MTHSWVKALRDMQQLAIPAMASLTGAIGQVSWNVDCMLYGAAATAQQEDFSSPETGLTLIAAQQMPLGGQVMLACG